MRSLCAERAHGDLDDFAVVADDAEAYCYGTEDVSLMFCKLRELGNREQGTENENEMERRRDGMRRNDTVCTARLASLQIACQRHLYREDASASHPALFRAKRAVY